MAARTRSLETLALSVLERLNEDLPLPNGPRSVQARSFLVKEACWIHWAWPTSSWAWRRASNCGSDEVPLSDQDLVELFDEPSVTVARFAAYLRERMNG